MKIVIDRDVVGELTDDGEIITDDIWLKKLANTLKKRRFEDLRRKEGKEGTYYTVVKVKKGDAGYVSAVTKILLDNGYGLEE